MYAAALTCLSAVEAIRGTGVSISDELWCSQSLRSRPNKCLTLHPRALVASFAAKRPSPAFEQTDRRLTHCPLVAAK